MNNAEKARELINKHLYLYGGDGLRIIDGDVYNAVLNAINEALSIPDVVGQSEQLKSGVKCMMCEKEKEDDGHNVCDDCGGVAF